MRAYQLYESWQDYSYENPDIEDTYDPFVEEIINYLYQRGDDPDEMGLTEDRIYETKREIEGKFRGEICRVMRLTPSQVKKLKPGDSLGNHWTMTRELVDPSNIRADGPGNLYWFYCQIQHDDVDWAKTVSSALMFGDEDEINPSNSARLILTKAYDNDGNIVRPELSGKVFHAG